MGEVEITEREEVVVVVVVGIGEEELIRVAIGKRLTHTNMYHCIEK